MESMNARLKVARETAGFPSARSAAVKHGWGVSTYAAHENGQNDFDPEKAGLYAKAFKTTAAWLLTGEGGLLVPSREKTAKRSLVSSYDPDEPDPTDAAEEMPPETGEGIDVRKLWPAEAIPELEAHGGLGTGHVIQSLNVGELRTVDEVKNDYWRIPSDFARGTLGTTPLHLLVVECEGDSMAPTLASGERVWVNTLHVKPSPDGLYAIRDVFDQVIVKRIEVAHEAPLRLRIISDNPKHNAREVGPDEVRIIGKVVAAMKLF